MQSFALVTNYNDARVSVFARDTATGMLTLKSTAQAGDAKGPKGIAVAPNNRAVYVANHADGKIYQYTFDLAAGTLDPMDPAWVKNLNNSGPEMVAIDPSGEYLFATNSVNGTVVSYRIDPKTATLTPVSSFALPGDSEPFGIVLDSSGHYIYVSDGASGLIYTFSPNRTGSLAKNGNGVASLGSSRGHPGNLAIGSAGKLLYVVDTVSGAISVFSIAQGTLTFSHLYPSASKNGTAIDLAVMDAGPEALIAEPMQSANALKLLSSGATAATMRSIASSARVSAPTAAAADRDGRYLYTADQGDGTVGIFALGSACPSREVLCLKRTTPSEDPPNKSSGAFWIALTH